MSLFSRLSEALHYKKHYEEECRENDRLRKNTKAVYINYNRLVDENDTLREDIDHDSRVVTLNHEKRKLRKKLDAAHRRLENARTDYELLSSDFKDLKTDLEWSQETIHNMHLRLVEGGLDD